MAKHCHILWRATGQMPDAIRQRLLESVAPAILELGVTGLAMDFADTELRAMHDRRPDGAKVAALVSVVGVSDEQAKEVGRLLEREGAGVDTFRVETELCLDYERDWALGERSPGVVQVSFLRRKVGLDDDAFIHAWHGVHTPLALEIHPLWRYDRNVVERALTQNAPPYEGLIELHFRDEADLREPLRMYGGDEENMRRISEDVVQWIDLESIVVVPMSQYVLR